MSGAFGVATGMFSPKQVSGLFGGNSPKTPDAPPAPTIDEAYAAGEEERQRLRRRRGMASTILAGQANTQPNTQTQALLGS